MGYPMTYGRVINRNTLLGNYTSLKDAAGNKYEIGRDQREIHALRMICGDLRRLEQDSVDGGFATQQIAQKAGVEPDTVIAVLNAFFENPPKVPPHDK